MLRIQLILYVVIILVLGGGFMTIRKQSKTIETLSNDIAGMEELYSQQVEYYQNNLERQTARFDAATLSYKRLEAMRESDRMAFIRQFEGVKRNLKNLQAAYTTRAEVVGTIYTNLYDTTIVNPDSTLTKGKKFHHKTEFLEARGMVIDSLITIEKKEIVPLEGVIYWQRQHWKLFGERRRWLPRLWGDKKYTVEIASPNPNVTITAGEYIQVQKK